MLIDDTAKKPSEKSNGSDNLSATDYRWLLELPHELDVLIAHHDFDSAISNVSKGLIFIAIHY